MYKGFYNDIENKKLAEVFSIIHSKLNHLFSFMNHKNTGRRGGHYNAAESRELISVIKETRIILETLKADGEKLAYKIEDEYLEVIKECILFLSSSGGSTIPDEFGEIKIIDSKPIFVPLNTTNISRNQVVTNANLDFIGGGSYAQVFRYNDSHYKLNFAIKRARNDLNEEELERFKLEYDVLRELDSPYIIKAYNFFEGKNEYVMECADQTLEKYMRYQNQYLNINKRKNLVAQLLKAFEYIHEKKMLHRDISYNNILLKHYEDGTSILKVSDFGLVKIPDSQLTRNGTEIKGSLNDYSDLTVVGFENYSIEHEIFALTKIIYFILTGKKSNYNREKNEPLKEFLLKGISPNKEDRYKSIYSVTQELQSKVYPALF